MNKLNLKESKLYTEDLTVGEALKELEGMPGLPMVVGGKIYSTVYPEKLIKAIESKNLNYGDSAKKVNYFFFLIHILKYFLGMVKRLSCS